MLKSFTEHPAAVGETYSEHCVSAWGFGLRMIGAGLACCMHGLFPFLCKTTGSRAIAQLHDCMIANRIKQAGKPDLSLR